MFLCPTVEAPQFLPKQEIYFRKNLVVFAGQIENFLFGQIVYCI